MASQTKTINIPATLHARLKETAHDRNLSITELATDILQRALVTSTQRTFLEPETQPTESPTNLRQILYTDAGTKANGTPHQRSRICLHDGKQVLLDQEVGNKTNNEAEILAIVQAIKHAGLHPTIIRSDSQLAVNLITGRWKGKKPHLQQLIATIYVPLFISIEWIPREENPAGWHLEQAYHI